MIDDMSCSLSHSAFIRPSLKFTWNSFILPGKIKEKERRCETKVRWNVIFESTRLSSVMANSNETILLKSPLVKKEFGKVASYHFEVTIPANAPDQFQFVFQNYYTSSITIAQEMTTGLKILLDKKILMEEGFNEVQAYDWHVIPGNTLIQKGLQKGKPIRIYLFQSTDMWSKIDLKNIKIVNPKVEERGINPSIQESAPSLTSLSACLVNDLRAVIEAGKLQSTLKQSSEYYYTQPDETKRSSRRKDRRKETRRAPSQENTTF